MSERRRIEDMTDPGPPPEEALDATLRALGAPVPAQARRVAESAGLEAAHYHAEPHRPPRAREETDAAAVLVETDPDPHTPLTLERDTVRMPKIQQAQNTTVPRANARSNRLVVFLMATGVVVVVLGVIAWAATRGGPTTQSVAATSTVTAVPMVPVTTPSPAAASAALTPVVSSEPAPIPPPLAVTAEAPTPPVQRQPTATVATTPRRAPPTATTSTGAPTPPATTSTAPPASTTKYNHLLNEERQ